MKAEEKLAALQVIHVAAWASYFTLTREIYAGDTGFLLLLAAAETVPTIAGIIGGLIAERFGYKLVFAIGVLEGVGLLNAGLFLDNKGLLWLSSVVASLAWSISGPQVYAYALTISGHSGRILGVVTAGSTLGWTVGSLAPIIAMYIEPDSILSMAGIFIIAVYLMLIAMSGTVKPISVYRGSTGRKRIPLVLAIAAFAFTGVEVIGSVYMGRLSREVGPTLYSIANVAAGLIAAAVRPIAGRIVDSRGPSTTLILSLLAYIVYLLSLEYSHSLMVAVVWAIPVYPFFELSLYKFSSILLGESLGVAIVSAGYSLTGSILSLAGLIGLERPELLLLAIASFTASALLTIIVGEVHGRPGVQYYSTRRGRVQG